MKKALLLSIISLVAITIFFTYYNKEYKKIIPTKEGNTSIKDIKPLEKKQEKIPKLRVEIKKKKKKKVKPSVIEVIPEYEELSETDLLILDFEEEVLFILDDFELQDEKGLEEIIVEIESEFNFE